MSTIGQSTRSTGTGRTVAAGAIAGLIGGVVMAMVMMIVTALAGMGFLAPLYAIAATFNRSWAMAKGVDGGPLLAGLMLHMLNSALFGLLFTLLLRGIFPRALALPAAALAGMAWGLILLVVNQFIVLPLADPPLVTATSGIFGWWLVGHLMYGVVLGAIVGATLGNVHAPLTRTGQAIS